MNLAGFVPLSLCDYPGRVAAVVFTQGCNYRCPWCHNGHLLPLASDPLTHVSEDTVLAVLAERRTRLGGVVVSGGEPTLQRALARFLRRIKALGLDVKLDTNGSRPEVLRQLLEERLLDYVAMDVKAPWERYAALTGVACCDVESVQASMALIASSGVPHAFRTTRVDPLLSEREYGDIRTQIPSDSPHTWQPFRPSYSRDPALRADVPQSATQVSLEVNDGR
jgi:pyruvate formate lyase activating enzyme